MSLGTPENSALQKLSVIIIIIIVLVLINEHSFESFMRFESGEENKVSHPLLPGIESATFQSQFRHCTTELSLCFFVLINKRSFEPFICLGLYLFFTFRSITSVNAASSCIRVSFRVHSSVPFH